MHEISLHISSVNRQKIGKSVPSDFTIKFNPVLKLDPEMKHEIALDRANMTYSWHNISEGYNNNEIKYSTDSGSSWHTIKFISGMYTYSDLNDFIHQTMKKNNHYTPKSSTEDKVADEYHINLVFVLSTYKIIIEIDNNYQLDLRNTEFGGLIGFTKKIVAETEYGTNLPNTTNSIDMIQINTDIVTNSIVNGINTNTLAVIPTDDLTRSMPFTFEPRRLLFNDVAKLDKSQMNVYLRDSLDREIDLNNIDWHMTLVIRSQ